MVEEIEDIKDRFAEFEQESLGNAKDLQVLQSEVQNLTLETRSHYNYMKTCLAATQETKKDLNCLKLELKSLKNLLFCAILFLVFYKFML